MAQLKVKQISDFVSAVEAKVNGIVGTANVTAIGDAKSQAISAAVSADVVVKSQAISAAVSADVVVKSEAIAAAALDATSKANAAQSTAISTAVSADTVLSTAVSTAIATVDGRVTTLLEGSTEALDTFGEIKGFIDSLNEADVTVLDAISTAVSNDVVHAGGISDNAGNISANATSISNIEVIIGAHGDIVTSYISDFATAAQGALADSALQDAGAFDSNGSAATAKTEAIAAAALDATSKANAAESAANGYTDGRETIIKAYADTAEADAIASAKTYTDTEISDLDTELRTVIAGVAGVDKLEQMAIVANTENFSVTKPLSLSNSDILVFVNGLQIHQSKIGSDGFTTIDGQQFSVTNLGYELDENDHIVVVGVEA